MLNGSSGVSRARFNPAVAEDCELQAAEGIGLGILLAIPLWFAIWRGFTAIISN